MEHVYWNGHKITGITRNYIQGKVLDYNDGYSSGDFRIEWEGSIPEDDEVNWLVFANRVYRTDSTEYLALIAEESRKQDEIDSLQVVNQKLSKTLYDLTSFIENKFLLTQTQIDQINAMTTLDQIKAVILDRFSLTQGQQDYINEFRAAYEAWIAARDS